MSKKNDKMLYMRLSEVCCHSPCTYKVGAIAFDKKGDILGEYSNSYSLWVDNEGQKTLNRRGTGRHAEARLIRRYGRRIRTILIMRVGKGGSLKPIDPCPTCQKLAEKYNIKIQTVMGSRGSFLKSTKNELPQR